MAETRTTLTVHNSLAAFFESGSCSAAGATKAARVDLLAERYAAMVDAIIARIGLSDEELARLVDYTRGIRVGRVVEAALIPALLRGQVASGGAAAGVSGLVYKLERLQNGELLALADFCERAGTGMAPCSEAAAHAARRLPSVPAATAAAQQQP